MFKPITNKSHLLWKPFFGFIVSFIATSTLVSNSMAIELGNVADFGEY